MWSSTQWVKGLEVLCTILSRFAYPHRLGDMVRVFGRSVPQLSLTISCMIDYLYESYNFLFESMQQPMLRPSELERYAKAIHDKGAAMSNCWGFVDGTVRPIARPSVHQEVMYNGHKRLHALKFQSVVTANGMIAHLYGPVEGRRHDCFLLKQSRLLQQLEQHSHTTQGEPLCIYGDPAYPLRRHLQAPFKGQLTPERADYNKSMSSVRIAVEWLFGDIVNLFKFVDFKKS